MPVRSGRLTLMGMLVLSPFGRIAAQQSTGADTAHREPKPVAQMAEITVTAAPARNREASSSLSIPLIALKLTPALNPYDRLRLAAGLEVHDQGQGPGFASNVSLRGFSSDHSTDVALWIDGVPINEPVNGHAEGYGDWSLMFPQAVRSVELFRGPTNPLYGNFALAGAVNIRTLERMRGTEVEVDGGRYGRAEGSVLTGWDHDASGGVVGIRGVREDGWRPNSGFRLGQGHFRAVRDLSSSATLDLGAELYAAGWDSPGFLTTEQFDLGQYRAVANPTDGGFKRRAQERASLRVVGNSGLLWRTTVYATQGRWQLFLTTPPEGGTTEGSGSQLEEEDRRFGFGGTSALSWIGSRAEVTLGLESRFDRSRYGNWFVTSRVRDSVQDDVIATQSSGALFLQSGFDVGPLVRLSAGGRLDTRRARVSRGGAEPDADTRLIASPKVGVLLRIPHGPELYTNVSRGFRQTDGVIRDARLPFITAWAYEAGLRLERGAASASVALFRMDVSNEQTFNPVTATSSSHGASRRQGVEVGYAAALGSVLRLSGQWSFIDAKYRRFVTEEGEELAGARVFNTAKYVGSTAVELAPVRARWRAQLSTSVVGPYTPFDAPGVLLPGYALLHLGGALQLGRAEVDVGIRNLLDRAYPELRAGEFVVPGQPLTLFGGVRYAVGREIAPH